MPINIDPWFLKNLVCPVLKTPLTISNGKLVSEDGTEYSLIDGIPIMLRSEWDATLHVARRSLEVATSGSETRAPTSIYEETLGISDDEQKELLAFIKEHQNLDIDAVVSYLIVATNGIMYKHVLGKLGKYPIPHIRLPQSHGESLLDVGCGWGRWSIAASRKGYDVIGIDPSLGAVMAARRVAEKLGLKIRYLVGDSRYLPFRQDIFDVVFSYSVIQHMSFENVARSLSEIKRVLLKGGYSFVQMPNKLGIRCVYHQIKRKFKSPEGFDVRYWSFGDLKKKFSQIIGPSTLSVDCFFGLGIQKSDMELMPWFKKVIIILSVFLTKLSCYVSFLIFFADSIYVHSKKNHETRN